MQMQIYCTKSPTSSSAGRDGGTVVFEVQSAGCVEDWVHKNVGLALLQHVQDFLQTTRIKKGGRNKAASLH